MPRTTTINREFQKLPVGAKFTYDNAEYTKWLNNERIPVALAADDSSYRTIAATELVAYLPKN